MPSAQIAARLQLALWHDARSAVRAHVADLEAQIGNGASHAEVLAALQVMARAGLHGFTAARSACERWPGSVDMAALAVRLGGNGTERDAALAALADRVARSGRRRATLALILHRLGERARARALLALVDAQAPGAAAEIAQRAELALAAGDTEAVARDLDWLASRGRQALAAPLRAKLIWHCEGGKAFSAHLDTADPAPPALWPVAFGLAISARDFTTAANALARWQAAPRPTNAAGLAQAHARMAIERREPAAARAILAHRLARSAVWTWAPADHLLWLRAGTGLGQAAAGLAAHAAAACRLYADHPALLHLLMLYREALLDWRMAPLSDVMHRRNTAPEKHPVRAQAEARSALRRGRPGRAAMKLRRICRSETDPPTVARFYALRAEALAAAGRPAAALIALDRAQTRAQGAAQSADLDLHRAERALEAGDLAAAQALLDAVAARFPARMPLWLLLARLHFRQGAFEPAAQALARFAALKASQTGVMPASDLRDRLVCDARSAAAGVPRANALFVAGRPVAQTLAQAGLARITASPGLSAWTLLQARAQGVPGAAPGDARACIPLRIAHYWEGPHGPALGRSLARWRSLHPGFAQRVFDRSSAERWLRSCVSDAMAQRFLWLSNAALRADLFRLFWLNVEGGVFADLDEYPRLPVTPWLEGARAVFCIERGFGTAANNFLAAEPGMAVHARALAHVLAALDSTSDPYAWWHSGPAQLTRAVAAATLGGAGAASGLRLLDQDAYCRRVATNLPFPHKRSAAHWR